MYSLHNHSDYSNASRGFADSSMKVKSLIKHAKEIGLLGVAITDHEIVGSYVIAKELEEELDFPVILGNEIYLVTPAMDEELRNNYDSNVMYYPHFILLALDEIGNKQIRQLSSLAWKNNYFQKGVIRTTTLTTDIENIIGKDKGHVIATSACIGGMIGRYVLKLEENSERYNSLIIKFTEWCQNTFGKENFYFELQPPIYPEQDYVNKRLVEYSNKLNIPYIITTDSHYLSKDKFELHKSFLNSGEEDEREVADFYASTYLMSVDEIYEVFGEEQKDIVKTAIDNTITIGNRAVRYNFKQKSKIPKIKFEYGWERMLNKSFFPNTVYIQKTLNSEYIQDRYLMYLIQKGIKELIPKEDYAETFDRVEQELTEIYESSEIIEDRLHNYFNTMNKLIDIMWTEGDSIVGVGRGSGVSSIIDYLVGIVQINPLKMPVEMPFYRFIDRARPEIPDIDIDTQSNRRKQIFYATKNYFESINSEVYNCCTHGTLGSKSAMQTACRGLGISSEDALNISSLIPVERGFNWSISDCYYGNEEKGRKPIKEFINIVDQYENLLEMALMIEGIIISRGTHASGIFITNEDFNNYGAVMCSPDGTLTSQWDLHDSEKFGLVKYDYIFEN